MQLVDQLNNPIILNQAPQRIISLVPSITEILHFLELENRVIGITKFCVHPKNWKKEKTQIGGTKSLNIEKIKQLQPDLIIANKEENTQDQIAELQKDFQVYISDIENVEHLYTCIEDIGHLTQCQAMALRLNQEIKTTFDELNDFLAQFNHLFTTYIIWQNPWMCASKNTFIGSVLQHLGLNIHHISENRYPEVTQDIINKTNIVLLSSEPFPFKETHINPIAETFGTQRVFLVDGEIFSWYGPRLLNLKSQCIFLLKNLKEIPQ